MNCRACKQDTIKEFLDLGKTPLANNFLTQEELGKEEYFSLRVGFCTNCTLVQLLDIVPKEKLFTNYAYFTGASQPVVEHFKELAQEIKQRFLKGNSDLVVDIGCNDGTFLKNIQNEYRILGIDPADNVISQSGLNHYQVGFFDSDIGNQIVKKEGIARVVVSTNMLAHNDDIDTVIKGFKACGERLIIEVNWVGDLIQRRAFDQIYHEHMSYYSLKAIKTMLERLGVEVFDVKLIFKHGVSLRVYAQSGPHESVNNSAIDNVLKIEQWLNLSDYQTYRKFAEDVYIIRDDLHAMLKRLKQEGKSICGYGAPAKSTTLLNSCMIGEFIDCIIDSTPHKHGLFTPGTHIRITSTVKESPDYYLLLSWNYADYILNKERDNTAKFILPIPNPKIL